MKKTSNTGQLRIIGGQWRGRKFRFRAAPGLRPTTDRVRETLFNWLAPVIHDAHCADLFAGSGALGLEALSRGASRCDFVDSSEAALNQIEAHLCVLNAQDRGRCHRGNALSYLQQANARYDIVFIDPPFGSELAGPCCESLAERDLLAEDALIYLEAGATEPLPALPADWQLHREKTAGGVAYRLFVVTRD